MSKLCSLPYQKQKRWAPIIDDGAESDLIISAAEKRWKNMIFNDFCDKKFIKEKIENRHYKCSSRGIEKRSFEMIGELLTQTGKKIDEVNEPVINRVFIKALILISDKSMLFRNALKKESKTIKKRRLIRDGHTDG